MESYRREFVGNEDLVAWFEGQTAEYIHRRTGIAPRGDAIVIQEIDDQRGFDFICDLAQEDFRDFVHQ